MYSFQDEFFLRIGYRFMDSPAISLVGCRAFAVYLKLRRSVWRSPKRPLGEFYEQGLLVAEITQGAIAETLSVGRKVVNEDVCALKDLGWIRNLKRSDNSIVYVLGEWSALSGGRGRSEGFYLDGMVEDFAKWSEDYAKANEGPPSWSDQLNEMKRIFVGSDVIGAAEQEAPLSQIDTTLESERHNPCVKSAQGPRAESVCREGLENEVEKGTASPSSFGPGAVPEVEAQAGATTESEAAPTSVLPGSEGVSSKEGVAADLLPAADEAEDRRALLRQAAVQSIARTEAVGAEVRARRQARLSGREAAGPSAQVVYRAPVEPQPEQAPRDPTAVTVEWWFRKEMEKSFEGLVLPKWGVKEKAQAKLLLERYPADIVERGIAHMVKNWRSLAERLKLTGVPSIALLASSYGNSIIGEAQIGVIGAKSDNEQRMRGEYDEESAARSPKIGWGKKKE